MPSTSLRPRKQKTIATRRSADSIYSKLGFEYNPAQMDRESFKHGFYAHNMGRPDTPQHVRRLLRGLNRHVETQDKIASAKDVGELLNPDFKAAVKGMTRKQQQRRYKRWEKIPVSNFTARMNALKKIHEASIDHVTPQLRAAADQAQIEVGKPFYRRKKVTPKEGIPITVGRLSRSSREFASGGSNAYLGKITLNPTNLLSPAEKKGAATHELLHVTDPGQLKKKELFFKSAPSPRVAKAFLRAGGIAGNIARSLPVPGLSRKLSNLPNTGNPDDDLAKYYSQRREAHAHVGTMGTLGIEGLKNHTFFNKGQVQQGINPDRIRQALRKGHLGKLDVISPELSHMRDITKLRHYNPQMQKLYRKSAKEFNLGIERVYGSRNTTGGTTNKFGQVKLARPIGRLPEELQEKFDDFNFRINRYGQPDFREVDRGKPGDYTHWNIYKPDKDPVLRPKDPVVRRPARAQMDTPKPSTARDRALAWRKRQGVQESFPNIDKKALMERVKNSNLSL